MEEIAEVTLVADRGIEGDRYFLDIGTTRVRRNLTFARSLFSKWKFWTRYYETILLLGQAPSRLRRPVIAATSRYLGVPLKSPRWKALTHSPAAVIHSQAAMAVAGPTTVAT